MDIQGTRGDDADDIDRAALTAHADSDTVQHIHATAAATARHLATLGFALTGREAYGPFSDDASGALTAAFEALPRDPDADDKRRAFASWSLSPEGELLPREHFSYQQVGNSQNAAARNLAPMPEELRRNPVILRVLELTIEVARRYVASIFQNAVRVDLHLVRYVVKGCGVALASPPYAHTDKETVSHVVLVNKQNAHGGHNYLAVGTRQPNVGFEMTEALDGFIVGSTTSHGVSPLLSADGQLGTRDIVIATIQPLAGASTGRQYEQAS